jgi:glycosyltransferase involved in cell wall biosynthesis
LTGFVAWHCRRHGKKFVFRIASDTDCVPGQQIIRYWRDKKIYEYGLRRADLIFAQSRKQIVLLEQNYGLKSAFMNMVVDNPTEFDSTKDIDVLWVSNIRPQKRPELVFDLAEKLPHLRFVMIGGPSPGLIEHFKAIEGRAGPARNVEFLGAVPYRDIGRYFSRAKVFVNTSDIEGFPNTFLQSWIYGVPVVSFFDPDDVIKHNGLGFAPKSPDEMIRAIDDLTSSEVKRREISRHSREYAIEHHSPRSNVKEYIRIFSSTLA